MLYDEINQIYQKDIKNKFIILTEIQTLTSQRTDNKYEENWRVFLELIINSLNDIIEELNETQHLNIHFLKNTNFQKKFHTEKKEFINISLYEFLTYDPPKDPEHKKNKEYGSFNNGIIEEMHRLTKYQTNQIKLFNELIHLDLKYIHQIFMQNLKLIKINGIKYDLSKFKKFNDYSDELKDILIKEKKHSEEEIEKYLSFFKNKIENLITKFEELKKNAEEKEQNKNDEMENKDLCI